MFARVSTLQGPPDQIDEGIRSVQEQVIPAAFGSLSEQASLGEFLIPQRGIFAVGRTFFEPFAEGRHLAVASREANRES